MNWIDNCIEEYFRWLKDKTIISKDESTGWHIISTPYLGLFNDTIDVYAKLETGKITLSDDGITLSNLELAGVSVLRSPGRKEWLEMTLLTYGIALNNKELQVTGTEKNFAQKKHNLICAISEISDMAMLEFIE